eukprot:IDg15045t1
MPNGQEAGHPSSLSMQVKQVQPRQYQKNYILARAGIAVLFIVSTAGNGEAPRSLHDIWRALLRADLPRDFLHGLRVAVLGLGDSSYARFNAAARRLRARLHDVGATELAPSQLADDSALAGIDATVDEFADSVAAALGVSAGAIAAARAEPLPPRARLVVGERRAPPRAVPADTWLSGEIADDSWFNARVVANDTLTDSAYLDDDRE